MGFEFEVIGLSAEGNARVKSAVIAKLQGKIAFEDATSEFLACSCGNNVMDSGFDPVAEDGCENQHFVCNGCGRNAHVDFTMRVVDNNWSVME
jgi:hypothetical protein